LFFGGATPLATNNFIYPGVVTTPVASPAGFATSYLLPNPFTNSGTFVMNNAQMIGFNVMDQPRYIGVNYIIGNQTNSVGAIFVGRKQQE
jgi:hypothetical protein